MMNDAQFPILKRSDGEAIKLSVAEWDLIAQRPNAVNHDDVQKLYYLGNYERKIAVSLHRMMENSHDWAHLPFVHSSSFASIALIDSGTWGWRAVLGLPGGGHQLLDLRVDQHYWVSTVFAGFGEGIEIHTQASQYDADHIHIDVRFYLPKKPNIVMGPVTLAYMKRQYKRLYDEDEGLMLDRQAALDWNKTPNDAPNKWQSKLTDLDEAQIYDVTLSTGQFCLRFHDGVWIVHSAICPHMLGPLNGKILNNEGALTCPWHGYSFDAITGASLQAQCGNLRTPPQIRITDGMIILDATAS